MNWPVGLVMDEHENILVADESNHRLLVLDRSLNSAREMSVTVDGGLRRPYSLWYDKSHGRLYIGEWPVFGGGQVIKSHGRLYIGEWPVFGGGQVIIIDHLKDFTVSSV